MTVAPETRYTRSADGTNLALPVEGPPVKRCQRELQPQGCCCSWLVAATDRSRCQGGAPHGTNDLDTGEDRRTIGPERQRVSP